jgi:H+/Cl- antiporter ClcA
MANQRERRNIMNSDYIVAGAGLLGFAVGMTVLWLFWITVWAEFWRRRIGRRRQADALGVLTGALFPLSVPVGAAAVAFLWLKNVIERRNRRQRMLSQ